jgi:UDP-N-acetylmuramate dehydrogenase
MLPNFSLRARNSFGFEVLAEQAYSITRAEQIRVVMEAIEAAGLPWRVLGGGSNVVLPPTASRRHLAHGHCGASNHAAG